MDEIKVGDYVVGNEYYGGDIRPMSGWADKVSRDGDGYLVVEIQCDDGYGGARGNTLYESLGEITKMPDNPRPKYVRGAITQ